MYSGNYSRISGGLGESRDLSFPLTAAMSQPCLARVAVFWLYWLLCWPWPSSVANPLVPSSFLPVPFVHDWMLWWDYAILESTLREAAFLWWYSAFSAVGLWLSFRCCCWNLCHLARKSVTDTFLFVALYSQLSRPCHLHQPRSPLLDVVPRIRQC